VSHRLAATLSVVLLAAACVAGSPQEVTLAELAAQQEAFSGEGVVTEGVLRTDPEPRHYWIEDTELHRVELQPHDGLSSLVGRRLRVTGTFTFDDSVGRTIRVNAFVRAG
jgi:hypothetical protein